MQKAGTTLACRRVSRPGVWLKASQNEITHYDIRNQYYEAPNSKAVQPVHSRGDSTTTQSCDGPAHASAQRPAGRHSRGLNGRILCYALRRGGLIVTESVEITPEASAYEGASGIYTEAQMAGWRKITDAIHRREGTDYRCRRF